MPWCDPCSQYHAPTALTADGNCPGCGEHIADPHEALEPSVPWHFWIVLAGAAIYLGWRFIQGVVWIVVR